MLSTLKNTLKIIGVIILFVFAFYAVKDTPFVANIEQKLLPCSKPVAYTLGAIDSKFKLSNQQILKALEEAEALWEKPYGKNLFTYTSTANLKVNFVYDSRQEATIRLNALGIDIEKSRSSYEQLKSIYSNRLNDYNSRKNKYELDITALEKRKDAYEAEVSKWNTQGGAPASEYKRLQKEEQAINQEVARLNTQGESLNQLAADVNALAIELNKLVSQLNINVTSYNTIGQSNGEEFQEGVYILDTKGERIDIFQFDSHQQLVRVLAHELGHALGLEHVEDKEAIMYKLNQSENSTATQSDINEITRTCTTTPLNKIKSYFK